MTLAISNLDQKIEDAYSATPKKLGGKAEDNQKPSSNLAEHWEEVGDHHCGDEAFKYYKLSVQIHLMMIKFIKFDPKDAPKDLLKKSIEIGTRDERIVAILNRMMEKCEKDKVRALHLEVSTTYSSRKFSEETDPVFLAFHLSRAGSQNEARKALEKKSFLPITNEIVAKELRSLFGDKDPVNRKLDFANQN